MTDDRIEAVNTLLVQAGEAHHVFETTELDGVYDQDWPRWYAAYALEHGLGEHLADPITTDRLSQFLADANDAFEAAEPSPSETWASYTARRLATEL